MIPSPRPTALEDASGVRVHLRTWGLLWAAVGIGLLLVGSTAMVYRGIFVHSHELAEIHGAYVLSKHHDAGSLDAQLRELRPFGVSSLSRFAADGTLLETVGEAFEPMARVPGRPLRIQRGRYRIERASEDGALVVEYAPMLAIDLQGRARRGLVLSVVASGLLIGFVSLWIRYRLRLESLTLEAERTRQLALLGTLSAVIAHELRNPLTVLMGHVQLLSEDLPASRSLGHVTASASRLEALLESLLAFAKTGEVTRTPTDPVQLLRDAVRESGLSPETVSGTAPEWPLDAVRMHQVLRNLLNNAVTASPDGGIEARVAVDDGKLVYEVRDCGSGIPTGMHEPIFEPFHTSRVHGTGLGLAVARAIVEKHGGTLTAHDAPGGGAVFRARIPT